MVHQHVCEVGRSRSYQKQSLDHRQDSAIVSQLKRALRGSAKCITYAGVFSSFAAGATKRDSDIDVLILEGEGVDRSSVMTEFRKGASGFMEM